MIAYDRSPGNKFAAENCRPRCKNLVEMSENQLRHEAQKPMLDLDRAIGKGLAMLWAEGNCTTERHCDLEGLRPDVDSDSKRCGHITATVDTRPSTSAPSLENKKGDRHPARSAKTQARPQSLLTERELSGQADREFSIGNLCRS
jgi:hypothetical protein